MALIGRIVATGVTNNSVRLLLSLFSPIAFGMGNYQIGILEDNGLGLTYSELGSGGAKPNVGYGVLIVRDTTFDMVRGFCSPGCRQILTMHTGNSQQCSFLIQCFIGSLLGISTISGPQKLEFHDNHCYFVFHPHILFPLISTASEALSAVCSFRFAADCSSAQKLQESRVV